MHRDIKPDNLLIFGDPSDPEKQYLKVTDFSVGFLKEDTLDSPETVAGTPSFMAPEIYEKSTIIK